MQQTNDVLFNLLDSHDTIRLRNVVQNMSEYRALLTLLFTMPGSVCIYYGTELGMEGGFDPDCRRCMPWEEIEKGKYNEQIEFIQKLTGLRKTEKLMRERNFHFPSEYENPRIVQFQKIGWTEALDIVVNSSDEDIELLHTEHGKVIFSQHLEGNILRAGGVCIRFYEDKAQCR